ncbi:MAG: hypothetical protein AAFY73_05270 [Pseudomonadota bacterium]
MRSLENMHGRAGAAFKQVLAQAALPEGYASVDRDTRAELLTEQAYWQAYISEYPAFVSIAAEYGLVARRYWRIAHLKNSATTVSTEPEGSRLDAGIRAAMSLELASALRNLDGSGGFLVCGNVSQAPATTVERRVTNALQEFYHHIHMGEEGRAVSLLVWLNARTGPVQPHPEFTAFMALAAANFTKQFTGLVGIRSEADILKLGVSPIRLRQLSILAAGNSVFELVNSLPACRPRRH